MCCCFIAFAVRRDTSDVCRPKWSCGLRAAAAGCRRRHQCPFSCARRSPTVVTEYILYDHRARVCSAFVVCLRCFSQLDVWVRDLMNTLADQAFVRDVVPGETHDCDRPCNGLRQIRRCSIVRGALCWHFLFAYIRVRILLEDGFSCAGHTSFSRALPAALN